MKPLLKYLISLFILLLVGYTQVFAHLYRMDAFSLDKKVSSSAQFQAHSLAANRVDEVYIEEDEVEEDDRFSIKKHFADVSIFSATHVREYFHKNITYSYVSKLFSSHTFFQSPYLEFRVFRL